MLEVVGAAALGYLLGSVPSADLAGRLAGGGHDVRREGTRNPGAVNAAAVLGRSWGAAVLVADMAKGALAGSAGRRVGGDAGGYAAAAAAIAGHAYPVWSGGHGGKGIATSAGATLAVFPVYFPVDLGVSIASVVRHRRAETVTRVACAGWVAASAVVWRLGLSNAWGPEPGPGLVGFTVAGSAVILAAFARARAAAAAAAKAAEPA
ncbi:MAG: glycerol-3-phosphate acyltransferase [Acidimicrobiales bacterium]